MTSLKFPKLFEANNTGVWVAKDYMQATKQNVKLTLLSERGELFGDPYFGLMLKHYMFSQNSYVLRDLIIDMIYTQLALFIPQVKVERKDISVFQDRQLGQLFCQFTGINQIDYTLNTYELLLLSNQE